MSPSVAAEELDPFDLPDWVGEERVVWSADTGLGGHLVAGTLGAEPDRTLGCDLLAVDQAYPAPVVDSAVRARAHQVWQHGEVLLVSHGDRTAVATPGTAYAADDVLEALTRLARAVGADPARWSVRLALTGRG